MPKLMPISMVPQQVPSDEPFTTEDYTTLGYTMTISGANGEVTKQEVTSWRVYYRDYPNVDHMPPLCQDPKTRAAHAAWWKKFLTEARANPPEAPGL